MLKGSQIKDSEDLQKREN
ncbi:hypothetical protein AVEN_31478-1, partial [Araneus ventricosus]